MVWAKNINITQNPFPAAITVGYHSFRCLPRVSSVAELYAYFQLFHLQQNIISLIGIMETYYDLLDKAAKGRYMETIICVGK